MILGNNILIEPFLEKVGLIFIPNKKVSMKKGKVISTGEVETPEFFVGDEVIYDSVGCTELDGKDIVRYANVLFVYR
jgi:hypothetical protein